MSDFKFDCPKCGQHLKCDVQCSGQQIDCPTCKTQFAIPAPPARPAPAMPKSGMTFVPETWRAASGSDKPPGT